jgi:hypothetical protein
VPCLIGLYLSYAVACGHLISLRLLPRRHIPCRRTSPMLLLTMDIL